jgi:hypothetical protein
MISNAPCAVNNPATSNTLIMSVAAYPELSILQNMTISASTCFDALQTIIAGGSNTAFIVENGGEVTLAAGMNIRLLPGVKVSSGGILHGFITPTGSHCTPQPPSGNPMGGAEISRATRQPPLLLRVNPNPTDGSFTVETSDAQGAEKEIFLDIYNMTGRKVRSTSLHGARQTVSLSGEPSGIYVLKGISESGSAEIRIIKR